MRKYRKTSSMSKDGVSLKKRIARTRRRAKGVGFLYLLGIIGLAAVACLPLFVHDLAPVGVMAFWKTFTNMDLKSVTGLSKVINSGIYALILLGLVINVFRAFGKLGWLCKKNASKTYGFNRNVFAMEDLGCIFNGSFLAIFLGYFAIAIICGEAIINPLMLIVLGAGVVIHLFAGFWGAKTGYFDIEKQQIVEQKRVVGRIAPFIRNLLQVVAIVVIMYCVIETNTLNTLLKKGELNAAIKNTDSLVMLATQVVSILCILVLAKHTMAITEFNIDGARGAGMKNFRIFTFITFLAAGAAFAYKYFVMAGKEMDLMLLIMAGAALVSFIIEVIMHKMPKSPDDKKAKKAKKPVEEEFSLTSLPKPAAQAQPQA